MSEIVVIQQFTLFLQVRVQLLLNLDNEDGSNDVFIVKDASIPAGSSLEIMSGNKLVLMNDGSNADNLEAIASAASALDVTVSVLEDV